MLHESPRRRKIEESMRVSFLSTLPEEEWERYQSELESKTGATWSRVNFMERSWDVIRRYGTQSIMKVGLNQPIMREVLVKLVLEMEIISQCGSGGLEDYRPSRTNMAKLKLEGQLDVVEYSQLTVPESVHMGDPAAGYVEMLKVRNSARGQLMAWSEKRAVQEYLKGLTENSNLNRKEYGPVMSSEANEIGLEKLLEISWRAALQRYFDETMHTPAMVAAYLAHPCTRTDLQVRLAWCLMGIKKAEYEASND